MKFFVSLMVAFGMLFSAGSAFALCDGDPQAIYALIPVNDSGIVDTGDKVIKTGRPAEPSSISLGASDAQNLCRSKWDGMSWIADTRFSTVTTKAGNYGVFVGVTDHKEDGMQIFYTSSAQTNGTSYKLLEDISGGDTCKDSTGVWYVKYCFCEKADCS